MSRARKYSDAEIIKALENKRGGVYVAADELGCSYKTIHRRAKRVPAIQEVIDKYRHRRTDVAEIKLDQAILNGEPWAILFQLKTQGKSRGYVERNEITGKDGNDVTIRVTIKDDND